jgi:endonuclease YncB( thermonuclease family)
LATYLDRFFRLLPPDMKRFHRSRRRELVAAVVVLLLAALRLWIGQPADYRQRGQGEVGELAPGIYEVERVVDGDTLDLKQPHLRIRLQGVNTPETVKPEMPVEPWGPEASAYTKQFIHEAGGQVRVEIDGEPLDRYGRHLAFLWSGDRLLNEELVRKGLARATLQYDFGIRKKDLLRQAQRQAEKDGVGIWSH